MSLHRDDRILLPATVAPLLASGSAASGRQVLRDVTSGSGSRVGRAPASKLIAQAERALSLTTTCEPAPEGNKAGCRMWTIRDLKALSKPSESPEPGAAPLVDLERRPTSSVDLVESAAPAEELLLPPSEPLSASQLAQRLRAASGRGPRAPSRRPGRRLKLTTDGRLKNFVPPRPLPRD